MNYLPFDLETALKHPERVVTRDGRKVSELHYFETIKESEEQIIAIIEGKMSSFYKKGNYVEAGKSPKDLFLLPEVKECWVNVYENSMGKLFTGVSYFSEKTAITQGKNNSRYIKTIHITNKIE